MDLLGAVVVAAGCLLARRLLLLWRSRRAGAEALVLVRRLAALPASNAPRG